MMELFLDAGADPMVLSTHAHVHMTYTGTGWNESEYILTSNALLSTLIIMGISSV